MTNYKIKTSRISFMNNYIIGGLFLLILIWVNLFANGLPFIGNLFLVLLISFFFTEGETWIIYRTYYIDDEKISRIKGFLNKERSTIPIENIAHLKMNKGIFGRLFNYGNIVITPIGHGNDVKFRGIRYPESLMEDIDSRRRTRKEGKHNNM